MFPVNLKEVSRWLSLNISSRISSVTSPRIPLASFPWIPWKTPSGNSSEICLGISVKIS